MPSNLPEVQKENWSANEIVMPDNTNSWGRAINTLSKAVPLYSACGNVYTATYTNNVYNLTPLSFTDNTSNVTVDSYVDGMSVIFQCPTNNLANCSVNVNSLGAKTIKTIDNVNLPAGKLNSGVFVELKYDKTNDCFKFQQDFNKADRNFSNLTEAGEKHFLNKSQITNCILEAPNGVATYSENTITIKQGLKVLIPNGRNADGTLNNIEYVVPSDVTSVEQTVLNGIFAVHRSSDGSAEVKGYYAPFVYIQEEAPNVTTYCFWFDIKNNKWFYHSDTTTEWTQIYIALLGSFTRGDTSITSLTPKQPFRAVDYNDNNYQLKSEKGTPDGYAPLDNNNIVPYEYLPPVANSSLSNLTQYAQTKLENLRLPVYCVNSGNVDSSGNPDLFTTESQTYINKSWTMPQFTSNTTYGTLKNSQSSSNAWYIFNTRYSYNGGTNYKGEVTWEWTCPDLIMLTSIGYRTATISHSSYSTSYLKVYAWDTDTSAYVLIGEKYTTGASDYTDTYTISLTLKQSTKFKFVSYFNGGANLGCKLHDVKLYGYKRELAGAGNLNLKVDDGTTYQPLTATFLDGEMKTYNTLETIDTSDLANGTYHVYLDKYGTLDVRSNIRYVQPKIPDSAEVGAIWTNPYISPSPVKEYTSDGWVDFNKVLLGSFTLSDGAFTTINTEPYNHLDTKVGGLSMPSSKSVDFTLGATGSKYTAPANGWVQCACTGTAGSTYFEIVTSYASACASFNGGWGRATIPVNKGDIITVYYGGTNFTKQLFKFNYAQGDI